MKCSNPWTASALALAIGFTLAQPVSAQISGGVLSGQPTLPTVFRGAFSGQLNSGPIGFRGFPSNSAFPGSIFSTYRFATVPQTGAYAATGIGVTGSPFSAFYGNPLASSASATVEPQTVTPGTAVIDATTGAVLVPGPAGQATIVAAPVVAAPAAVVTAPVSAAPAVQLSVGATGGRQAPTQSGALKPRGDLQQIIDRSSALSAQDAVRVFADGATVVLRGTVASAHEARVAEGLLRLEPGVNRVRNELTVRQR